MAEQVITLVAATNKLFLNVDIKKVKQTQMDMLAYFKDAEPDVIKEIEEGKVLTDDERNNDIWNANMCRGMSDLIFFLRQRQEKTAVKLQSLIRRIGTIEGIGAVEDYRDLYELSAKDLERLLLVLAEDTEYEKVVFDIGFFGDGSMELLKCMDKLFVPQPATRSQQCKCKSWEALLKKEGLEECLAKMQYVAVNHGRI